MDTGHGHLLSGDDRARVLDLATVHSPDGWLGGAIVPDSPGDPYDAKAYAAECESIGARGGVPVVFPSHGLAALDETAWVAAHRDLADHAETFIAFELGAMFHPAGRVVSLETYRELLDVTACVGAKHSSLERQAEWDRLEVRDRARPEFRVFTGNDLAIDMVMFGSDYLLGLSTFAPDEFARRDLYWERGDPRFFELNDVLQYLGQLAFRAPVPAYRHSAAQFLCLRGWIDHDGAAPGEPRRPASDVELLAPILERLLVLMEEQL
jgi:dihydrodipicolinate synthase/N-acetylneuraminate lyase